MTLDKSQKQIIVHELARQIESAIEYPEGWLDLEHDKLNYEQIAELVTEEIINETGDAKLAARVASRIVSKVLSEVV